MEHYSASKLHKMLLERYNLNRILPIEVTVQLPHSKETVKLATHNVRQLTTDILTDPRAVDEDFLFHNNDPTAAPPEHCELVGDLVTTRAYRETYKSKIAPNPRTKCGRH